MKKILLMLTMVAVSVIAFAQSNTIVLQSNASKAECTKDAFEGFNAVFSYQNIEGEVISTERGNFTVISIEGTYPTGLEGTPQLPASRKLIAVPQGATPVVTVKNYTETEYDLNDYGFNAIYPNQPSVRKDMKPEDVKFIYSEKAYAAKGYQEREIAQVEMLGTMRNMRIATLTVNPVVYDASSNTVKVRNNIEVEVTFEGADKMATQSLYEATYSIYFESLYRQMFNRSVYDDHPDLWAAPVHMIVVAPDSYNETLQPWLAWKTKKGFYVDLYNTSETGTTYTAIRDFVHNKYNEGVANSETPVFLVLVGDTPQIPGTNGSSSQEVTDLYYSSVDGDYFPEMFCSRMCCENTTTLASLINKILVYEKATMPDPSYLGNALLIAGADSGWNPQVGQPAINYATTYHFNTDHNYNAGGVHAYLSSYTNCYSWLNSGVAIANYTAHGSNTSWADPSFSVSNVASLTNVDKYFLAIGNCCIAADFGYSGVCLAEAMIRADQKGAYTYIGSCPSTYWYEDYYWGVGATTVVNGSTPTPQNSSTGVYDGMNMIDTYNTTNSIIFLGNLAVCYAHDGSYQTHSSPLYYWQAYHVLGDGSIMPYCGLPTENTVSHLSTLPIGLNFYEISAEPGSYAAVSKDGVLYGAALVDETGTVQVPLNPPITSGGNVDIVVTCPNKYPYMATVPAASMEGPYITVSGVEPTGDGIVSYGETTGLSITIENVGAAATTGNTVLTIASSDEDVTINTATATYGPLAVNGTATMSSFSITVSEDVEDGQKITFNTTAVCGSNTWEGTFRITVYKPVLEYDHFTWPGSFEPGQTFNVTTYFTNDGGYEVSGVEAVLSTTSSYVTINGATQSMGTIAPSGTGFAVFSITVDAAAPSTEVLDFTVDASGDDGAITASSAFNLKNSCNVIFDLFDSYGDGWNGASLSVAFDDGSATQSLTISSGSTASYTLEIGSGVGVTVSFVSGSWNSECSFEIYYEDGGDMIYASSGTPSAGVQCTFVCTCGATPVECDPVENLEGAYDGSDVLLTWNAAAESYNITRNGVNIGTTAELTYTDAGVAQGNYTYCVFAIYSDGCESDPSCVTVVVNTDSCNPVQNMTLAMENNSVIVDWDAPEGKGLESYSIERDGVEIANITATNYTDADVVSGTTYTYSVIAQYVTCNSDPVDMTVQYLGVNDYAHSVELCPNPATDYVTVSGEAVSEIRVVNNMGQIVKVVKNSNIVNVSSFDSGIYFFSIITSNGNVAQKKIVVNR